MSSDRILGLASRSGKNMPARRRLGRFFLLVGRGPTSEGRPFESAFVLPQNRPALTLDHGLIAAGVAAAISSAAFAGYMMTHENGPPAFGGAEHLRLFAQPLGSGSRRVTLGSGRGGAGAVDYNATGSIRHGGALAAGGVGSGHAAPLALNVGTVQLVQPDGFVEGYVLRFVHNGLAIVQGRKGSYAVGARRCSSRRGTRPFDPEARRQMGCRDSQGINHRARILEDRGDCARPIVQWRKRRA